MSVKFINLENLSDFWSNTKEYINNERKELEDQLYNWQNTKKAKTVMFKSVPETDLEPVVDFLFTETPPAEGEKGLNNPSTVTGVNSINIGRIGKNLLLKVASAPSWNGLSITANADGSYTINGTFNGANEKYFVLTDCDPLVSGNKSSVRLDTSKTYTISAELVSGTISSNAATINFSYSNLVSVGLAVPSAIGKNYISKIVTDYVGGQFIFRLNVKVGAVFDNAVLRFQLEEGTEATDFEPPMLLANANYTISLNDTYYGGSLDVSSGTMTVTHASLLFNGSTNFSDSGFSEGTDTYTLRLYPSPARSTALPSAAAIACDRLPATPGGIGSGTVVGFYFSVNSASVNLVVSKTDIGVSGGATKAAVQTAVNAWFANHPAILVYPVANPSIVQLTPIQICSLPALNKYEPRINTVYTDQETVQVGYQKYAGNVVKAFGTTTNRTLSERFADIINVKDFGAKGDGVTDDTAAIQSAFDYAVSKEKPCCIYFPQGIFVLRCTEPTTVRTFVAGVAASFTSPVEIIGCGTVLKADPNSNSINILCSITTTADISLRDITVDCNNVVETGIDIYRTPNSSGTRKPYADCRIDNITVKNVYKWSSALTDSALYITGEFRTVIINGVIVNKCVAAANALSLGSVGVYGITINRTTPSGGETVASNNVFLNNITVEDVYCEDSSYTADQDAIRIFSNYKPDDAKINLDSALVSNVYCRNIRGRIAKCQMHYVTFNNANLVNDGDGAGFIGIAPNRGVIENQCGGVNINNMNVYVKNSHICSSLVRSGHIVTLKKQDDTIKYPGISYQGGVNISNVKSVIILDSTLKDSFNTNFNAFVFTLHGESGSTSVDNDLAGSYIFNFNNIIIESNYSFNTFVNFSRGEAVHPIYYNLSNCTCSCRSVLVRTSGTSTEKNISTSMVNVKNLAESPSYAFTPDYSKKSSFSNVNGFIIGNTVSKNEQNMVPVIYCNGDSQYTPTSTDTVVAESVTGICSVGIIGAEIENNGSTTYYNARLHLGTKNKKEIGIVRAFYGSSSHLILGANGTEITSVDENCFRPQATSLYSLGLPQYTWSNVYADTGPWASSDARLKSEIENVSDAVMRAWSNVHVKIFKYKNSIENKGIENARMHLGFIAQEVLTAFANEGLDAFKYGILGYDKWEDEYEPVEIVDSEAILDTDGNVLQEAKTHIEQRLLVAAGDRYSIRYEEALALECAYQRWLGEQRDAKIEALMQRISALENNQ